MAESEKRMPVRERLEAVPSPDALALIYGPRLQAGLKDFRHMLRVHKAHAVMLVVQSILTREVGAELLSALQELEKGGLESMSLDPKLEDLFYNIEAHITTRVGVRVAGQLHTGRSRNDLGATIDRMHARDHVNNLCSKALEMRRSLLSLAASHTETLMPGYTHLKPAQPITLGFYLSGLANALERDTRRTERVYEFANLSPLGAAALAGTSFPIDRHLTMRLLGFDGLVENCLDAVASRDYALELIASLALLATTLSRVATDLYVWQSDEFGMVELSDAIAGSSSIMPQKKNPSPLEYIRAHAAQSLGALVATLAAAKGTVFSNNNESGKLGLQPLSAAVEDSLRAIQLLGMILLNLSVDRELMMSRANRDFSSATDLADLMVRRCGVSFREAHAIVGGTVLQAVKAGMVATDITVAMLEKEAIRVVERGLGLSQEEVRSVLDPVSSVASKATLGGPAPTEVGRMLVAASERLEEEKARLEERKRKLAEAQRLLDGMVRTIMTGH